MRVLLGSTTGSAWKPAEELSLCAVTVTTLDKAGTFL